MIAQYVANATTKIGGTGSGSWPKKDKGLINTNLTGYTIVAKVRFHPVGESIPGNQSPFPGKSRTSGPKIELERN